MKEKNGKRERQVVESAEMDALIEAPLKRQVTTGFVIAVLLTIFIGFLSWRGARLAAEDADWVAHTYAVMDTLELTTKHMIESETSARGFALTGQAPLLTHYETARGTVAQDEDLLRHLTADNANQQRRLDVLESQVWASLSFAEGLVSKRKQSHAVPGADEILETEKLMDAMRATSQEMRAEEARLLSQRTERTIAGRRLTSLIMFAGVLAGAGFLAVALFAVNREIDVSARARAQISTLNAELEQRVEQRTAALESEITERKQAEQALGENLAISERVLKELADQKFALDQHAIVAVTDVHGTITYVNEKFCAISHYPQEELIGRNHRILNSGYHSKDFFQQMYHSIANGKVWHGEIKNRAKDGSIYWVDTTVVPTLSTEGKPRQYVAIRADITERKLAAEGLAAQAVGLSKLAEELSRSRQDFEAQTLMLQSVLDSMAEGLVAADEQGKFLIWNRAAERIVGYGPADISTEEWSEHYGNYLPDGITLFPTEQLPLVRAIHGEASTAEIFLRSPKVSQGAWIEASGSPLRGKDGVVHGGVVAFRDITQRRADEREILKLNDELEVRVAERTAQLEAANKELEAFSYSVSHDLRAPLRHIIGFSRMLLEEFGPTLDPGARHYLDRIQVGTQKMGLLVDELLNLAKVGRHAIVRQATRLNAVVEEVVTILEPDLKGREVQWVIGDLPLVECDPVLVKQIFQNLLANALKFTRTRAPAVIQVNRIENTQDEQPVFVVRDNGIGFNMKYVDKLFGVFQRLHRPEDFEGTGIGLATVQRIVQKHGGRAWAEGELDKGAAFYFTLGVGKQAESKSSGERLEANHELRETRHTVGRRQPGRHGSCTSCSETGEAGQQHLRRTRWRGSFGLSLLPGSVCAQIV